MFLPMQRGEQQKQGKSQAAPQQAKGKGGRPLSAPGLLPGEQAHQNRQHQACRTGYEQQYPGNIRPGLVELPKIPTICHQEGRRHGDGEGIEDLRFVQSGEYTPLWEHNFPGAHPPQPGTG